MRWALLLAATLAALADEPVPPEVQAKVSTYLATRDSAEAKRLEAELKGVPFEVLDRAVAEDRWGEALPEGPGEFEIAVPASDAKTKVCYWLPQGYTPERAWPAVLSIHGTTGHADEERMRWQMREPKGDDGFIIVCPEEQEKLWGKGWGSTDPERSLTLASLADAMRRFRIDPDRVFLAGVSRGGHATWEMGMLYGDRFAGLYSNAGGIRLVNFGYLKNLVGVPLLESLGGKDQEMLVANVREAVKELGDSVVYHEHEDAGHGVGYGDDPEFVEWMGAKRRDGWPKRVVHAFSKVGQGRAYWLCATKVTGGVLDPTKEAPSIPMPAGKAPTEEEKRALFRKKLDEGVARVEAKVEGNRVDVTTRKVSEVVVHLSDRLVNMDEVVEIWVNGKKKHEAKVARDGLRMLQHVRETGDRGRRVANWIRIAVN